MESRRLQIFGMAGLALAMVAMMAVGNVAALAKSPTLLVPSQLEKGRWTLIGRGAAQADRRICLGDPQQLVQVEHGPKACTQYIIENTPRLLTVHYSCDGAGYGRTTIRRETNRLAQVETQGVHKGRLFDDRYEARRVGSCAR